MSDEVECGAEGHYACADFVHIACDLVRVHSCASPAADGVEIKAMSTRLNDSSAPYKCFRCDEAGLCPPPPLIFSHEAVQCNATHSRRYLQCTGASSSGAGRRGETSGELGSGVPSPSPPGRLAGRSLVLAE